MRKDKIGKSENRGIFELASPFMLLVFFGIGALLTWVATMWTVHMLHTILPWLAPGIKLSHWIKPPTTNDVFTMKIFHDTYSLKRYQTIYRGMLAIGVGLTVWIDFRIWRKYHHINYHEYGKATLASPHEIRREYQAIPDRNKSFPGYGGVPISHVTNHTPAGLDLMDKMDPNNIQDLSTKLISRFGKLTTLDLVSKGTSGKYYIDQSTVNSLVIGITRSGKGEMFVNPLADILSRAGKKSSMVINDPKGELFQMAYVALRKRNYNVQVLNLQDMNSSMSYNPLAVAVDFAKRGYYDKAQQYINSVSNAIYTKPGHQSGGNDDFWIKSSISLLNALILALMDIAQRSDSWKKVTLRNAQLMLNEMGGDQVMVNADNEIVDDPQLATEQKSKLSLYFENFQKMPYAAFRKMAFNAFQQSNFAGKETAGSIYSSALEGLQIYQQDNIAQLTSMNSIDLNTIGFPRQFRVRIGGNDPKQNPYLSKIAKVHVLTNEGKEIESRQVKIDRQGYVVYPIENKCPDEFVVRITFDNRNNPAEMRSEFVTVVCHKSYKKRGLSSKPVRDQYTGKPILVGVNPLVLRAKTQVRVEVSNVECEYSEQPTALFLVTPPHNPAYNVLVSFLVDQTFNLNYDMALSSGRKTFNRIHFLLDEFGNLPPIPNMPTKVSIGLGQNILFEIIVQNLEQLSDNYGKEGAATIQSNCANIFYILTNSTTTAEMISKIVGKRTVNVKNLSGDLQNLNRGNLSDQRIGQSIFEPNELMDFKDGEMLVLRATTRRDKHHRRVKPSPIYNVLRKYLIPSRWMFLNHTFKSDMTMGDIPVETPHLGLNLADVSFDYNEVLESQLQDIDADNAYDVGTDDDAMIAMNNDLNRQPVLFNNDQLDQNAFMQTVEDAFLGTLGQIDTDTTTFNQIKQNIREERGRFFTIPPHNQINWLQDQLGTNYESFVDTVKDTTQKKLQRQR
ncbi:MULTISPECIES: VirD4-like conjugal transfer protein, CD1115 family [Pediococcus]|uniref:VirD4-like conjugal transfer protein, CD1115 family n=1 Tax=Pediococcus TaxID=1253 RepID=UPI00070DD19F|nr:MULTISPECIES: type IV secretory system conjugative DNA transfer family protein [Pediococcus]AVL00163.1 hypothetical protein PI20285_05635 [Pediococcus inopinatus]KRN59664.1 hypothetical protein IV83_GL001705 [Pediococcus inopinatus]PIO80341.1 hypothetical protein BSQ38_01015 [Pediococcus damnosus]